MTIHLALSTVHRRLILTAASLIVAALAATAAWAQDDEIGPDREAEQATVFLMQTFDAGATEAISCVGSGTLISEDGLILTNAHLALAEGPCRGERIVVALSPRLDEPPVPTYIAEVVNVDQKLDLAVLQIVGSLDGSLVDLDSLNLPAVNVTETNVLAQGSPLTVIGYPDIASSSVERVLGVVTGVTAEESGGSLAWWRTDSEIGGVAAGGGAYDAEGNLVGVATSAPGTDGDDSGDMCLGIQDSTRDGLITELDACVPVGAAVTAVRPIVFASPLIEAAESSFVLDQPEGTPELPPTADPAISRLLFSASVNEYGQPMQLVTSLPSGADGLYLFFDYANMLPGTPYEVRVTRDGTYMPQFSLGPLAWGGDTSGMWYVGSGGKTLPDGLYEYTVLINGEPAAVASITVGGDADAQSFANVTFGVVDASGVFQPGTGLLPAGLQRFDARFDFTGMLTDQAWTEVWILNGAEVFRETRLWNAGRDGQTRVSANNSEGLPLGNYRLELYIGERLAATGDITLAGAAQGGDQSVAFSNLRIASDITREGAPAGQIGDSGVGMPTGTRSLYAFFDWSLIPTGTDWTTRWYLDGRLIASQTKPWNAGGVGDDYWVSIAAEEGSLPEGEYAVEVLLQDHPMFSASATVGSGTQPISGIEGGSDEVMITGRVVDALTGEGVAGAQIVVLDVALESPSFTWVESDIHTQAVSDRSGAFALPRGLPRGNYYTMYVFAEGYVTIVEDNLIITSEQESPAEMVIELSGP